MTGVMLAGAFRLLLFALLWTVLSGADWSDPAIAVLTIAAATAASLRLSPVGARRIRWTAVPALLAYFLWNSLIGGVDVARRVFSPAMPVLPGVLEYQCSIDSETGRVLFAWMIGLMPGTASVGWGDEGRLAVHVIDRQMYDERGLMHLEKRLLAILGRRAS